MVGAVAEHASAQHRLATGLRARQPIRVRWRPKLCRTERRRNERPCAGPRDVQRLTWKERDVGLSGTLARITISAAILMCGVALLAQDPTPPQGQRPTFRTGANLVRV